MTMDKHLTVLGALFLGVAALGALGCLAVLTLFGLGSFILGSVAATDPSVPPFVPALPAVFGLFLCLAIAVTTIPGFVAAYALLKKLPWAGTAALIAGVLGLVNIPLGTGVGIYAIWFYVRYGDNH
jgi:hypothetical protein